MHVLYLLLILNLHARFFVIDACYSKVANYMEKATFEFRDNRKGICEYGPLDNPDFAIAKHLVKQILAKITVRESGEINFHWTTNLDDVQWDITYTRLKQYNSKLYLRVIVRNLRFVKRDVRKQDISFDDKELEVYRIEVFKFLGRLIYEDMELATYYTLLAGNFSISNAYLNSKTPDRLPHIEEALIRGFRWLINLSKCKLH